MAEYSSPLPEGTLLIGDGYGGDPRIMSPPDKGKGWIPPPRGAPLGQGGEEFYDTQDVLTRQEIIDRVEQMDKDQDSLEHQTADWEAKSQGRTNFCWSFGVTAAAMRAMFLAGFSPVPNLSATSLACRIYNFVNRGAWGDTACSGATIGGDPGGWSLVDSWPEAEIDRRYDTPGSREEMKELALVRWMRIKQGDRDLVARATMTALLNRMAIGAGYNHWSHLICLSRPLIVSGQYAGTVVNSWGSDWGDNGRGVLVGSKFIPDGAVIPYIPLPR